MNKSEFKKALRELGINQRDFAALAGIEAVSMTNWWRRGGEVPRQAAQYVRLLLARPDVIPDAWRVAGLPDGRK